MRDADTYRAARRNQILRVDKTTWGAPGSYYEGHTPKTRRATYFSRSPSRYHPIQAVKNYVADRKAKKAARVAAPTITTRARASGRGQ